MGARIGMLAISGAIGLALALAAPRTWEVSPFHGLLFGAAFYVAALRHGAGALARGAAFLLLAAAQAYVLFSLAPGADLRATFVILSTWIVLETVGDRPAGARAV
jgi:hypothetical protein